MSIRQPEDLARGEHKPNHMIEAETATTERRKRIEQAVLNMKVGMESEVDPVGQHERVPGTPALSLAFECTKTFRPTDIISVIVRVTYEGITGPNGSIERATEPITFRCFSILGLEEDILRHGFRLYVRRPTAPNNEGNWQECGFDEDYNPGFKLYDAPDSSVSVATDKGFTSLYPGESWTMMWRFDDFQPKELMPGDVFCCGFKGGLVDWWNWGSAEDHANTVVDIPCHVTDRVTNPKDNDGRPDIIIPATQPIIFEISE